ncbi:choice-of-anchor E domain-containing protein [archaeon]|jgi:hypothetical protein|nr:choice-of-anchor E domain-containing protein [archaeon]MBT6182347.1 choice-of-anchor E domain-containing protein [archaeon]MBT6606488.1 choice-of-anchor E domain-containing protein [archaeon]MBT7251347.1 choice-of-anchor E domain-containing protein [archaeon]MBT7660663.1 choice-of-anchor E domain-containing protein [archaeon]
MKKEVISNNNFYKHAATILVTLTITLILLNSLFPSAQFSPAPTQTRITPQLKEHLNFEFHTVELPYYDHDAWYEAEIPLFDSRKGDLEFIQLDLRVGSDQNLVFEDLSNNNYPRFVDLEYPISSLMFYKNSQDDSPFFFSSTSGPPSSTIQIRGPYDGTQDYEGDSGFERSFYSQVSGQFPEVPLILTSNEDKNYFTKDSSASTKTIHYFDPALQHTGPIGGINGFANVAGGSFTLVGGKLHITYGYKSNEKVKLEKPIIPQNFQASFNTKPYIHLTWDKSQGATNYAIFRSGTSNPTPCNGGDGNSDLYGIVGDVDEYKDTGNIYGFPIHYAVLAIGPGGQGDCSNAVVGSSLTPGQYEANPPSPPENIILTQTSPGTVQISWQVGPTGGPYGNFPDIKYYGTPEGYEIRKGTYDAGPYWIIGTINDPQITSFTDENMNPDEYFYRIKAINSWGASSMSNRESIIIA